MLQFLFRRKKNVEEIRKFTRNFTVEGFLEDIPNPIDHFYSTNYKSSLCDKISPADENYALKCLINLYPFLRKKDIEKIFKKRKNLIESSDILAKVPRHFRKPRVHMDIGEECDNTKLLQEVSFIQVI